ncbi:MAG: DUF1467 family protein [Rhodospirillales bacterium]|nr:DUF1467 family protein [Rhodospirillales bacterium]MCB9965179.1 DUF1467 family protein [Rhodospirillales bacterium]MCB9973198.1 DUF1467 family protein [Rhodospirillales bacterium]MCB9979542.1 DUF1467 family protein [Rhodospirillales bacterium]
MGFVSGLVAYICIWWVIFFCTLPIGVQPHQEQEHGTAGSAPQNPRLKFKILLTTGLSAGLWLIVYLLIANDVIDFYQIADQMYQDDRTTPTS